ncbi:MAG: hypothetical protein ACQERZ_07505 [Fusobacteriota bacterium]
MSEIIEEVEGFYKIYTLDLFRKTKGVKFDVLTGEDIPNAASIDRVIHESGANSPGRTKGVKRPWYMHPCQADNLIVLQGTRNVDLYSSDHGKIEKFVVEPNKIMKNGKVIHEGGAILAWSTNVFHRIVSEKDGSASVNFAVRSEGFDIDTNFNIYDLNTETGEYEVLREGHRDQY